MACLELSDSARLAYGETGRGSPLMLVHGSPGDGRSWARVIKHLPADLRTLTPDLPGYGGSTPLPAGTTRRTAAMGVAVGRLLEGSAERAWLCGHSYGGNVVLHIALQHRERVKGIALLEPVFMRALELTGEHETLQKARTFFNSYVARVLGGEPEAVSAMIEFWFGPGAFEKLPPSVQGFLIEAAPKNVQDVQAAFSEEIIKQQLNAFDRPVLVAYGAASPPITGIIASALAKLMPRAEVVSVPRTTHGMLDTHSAAVAGLIERLRHKW
jgi:pimeloyl-ACP methyl ester carboxylesterase